MKASEQALEELHSTVAKILKDRLEEDEVDAKTIELDYHGRLERHAAIPQDI